jgi:hypothetical protein
MIWSVEVEFCLSTYLNLEADHLLIIREKSIFDHPTFVSVDFGHRTQNRVSLNIQLLTPFTIGHGVVLMSGFNFFIYNLVLRSSNDYYFLLVPLI